MIKHICTKISNNMIYGALPFLPKKKPLRSFLILVSIFVFWISSAFAMDPPPFSPEPNYYGTFTKKIYNQEEVLKSSKKLLPQEVDEECIKSLRLKKEQQLGEKMIDRMRKKVTYLRDESKNDENRIFWDNFLGNTSILPFALIGCECPHEFALITAGTLIKTVGGCIVSKFYDPPIVAQLKRQTKELEDEINHRFKGLDSEKVSEFEKQYVRKKRFLDPLIQCEIEDALLEGRNAATIFPLLQMFLRTALLLPTAPKRLLGQNPQEDILDLRQRFNNDPFFAGFSSKTNNLLLSSAENIAYASISKEGSSVPKRERLFLWGNPGCGKTSAAKKLAKFLKVPCYKTAIRSASELNPSNLEGVHRYRPDVNVGWLVEPLLVKMEENSGATYNNGFLIIEDFHHILFGPQGATALAFLLDYIDPEKKKMQHAYFRIPINIRRLNIIITSNKPIPLGDNSPQDTFAALRSRIKSIEFPDLEETKCKGILRNYLKELHQFYSLASWITLEYTENNHLIFKSTLSDPTVLRDIDLTNHPVRTAANIRDRKQSLQDVIQQHSSELREQASQDYKDAEFLLGTDKPMAIPLFKRAAEFLLGTDKPMAIPLFKSAARKGKVEAAYRLGQLYIEPSQKEERKYWYQLAQKNKHIPATWELAKILEEEGMRMQAKALFEEASQEGDVDSLTQLGRICENEKNDDQAEQHYQKASKLNHPEAKRYLALLYTKKEKYIEANTLYLELLQANLLVPQVAEDLYKLGEKFELKDGISPTNTNAMECFRKSANQGYVLSHLKIGMAPLWKGMEFYDEKTITSLRFASQQDNAIASNILGYLYLNGYGGVPKRPFLALKYFGIAKDRCLMANYNLVYYYRFGTCGIQQNHQLANTYFSELHRVFSPITNEEQLKDFVRKQLQNQPLGMYEAYATVIGNLHNLGWVYPQDTKKARNWWKIAADTGYVPAKQGLSNTNSDKESTCIIQ